MERAIFTKEMAEPYGDDLDLTWVKNVVRKNIDTNVIDGQPRGHKNLIIVMEENSEMIQVLSSALLNNLDRIAILEEMADIYLGLYYLEDIIMQPSKEMPKVEINCFETSSEELLFLIKLLSMLNQEISKYIREKGNNDSLFLRMKEIELSLNKMQDIFGISDGLLWKAIQVKTKRIDDVLKKDGIYK